MNYRNLEVGLQDQDFKVSQNWNERGYGQGQ